MPDPRQTRDQRINDLVDFGKNQNAKTIDKLIQEALDRWPTVSIPTIKGYAVAALRIIKKKETTE